jgi:hypothetical protein
MSNPEDDRIDFSALDPSRDRVRWEARIAAIAAAGRKRPSLFDALAAWARPALAAAAAIAVVVWGAAMLTHRTAPAQADPYAQVIDWSRGQMPQNAYELLEVLHGE